MRFHDDNDRKALFERTKNEGGEWSQTLEFFDGPDLRAVVFSYPEDPEQVHTYLARALVVFALARDVDRLIVSEDARVIRLDPLDDAATIAAKRAVADYDEMFIVQRISSEVEYQAYPYVIDDRGRVRWESAGDYQLGLAGRRSDLYRAMLRLRVAEPPSYDLTDAVLGLPPTRYSIMLGV